MRASMDIQEILQIYGLSHNQKEQTGDEETRIEKDDAAASSSEHEGSEPNKLDYSSKVSASRSFADALTGKGISVEQET